MKTISRYIMTLALLLTAVTGAWAQAPTIYFQQDYSTETVDWTTNPSGRYTPIIEDGYLTVMQDQRNNNGTTLTCTATQGKVDAGKDFTMTFNVKLGASSNQTTTAFNIYDAENSGLILSLAEGAAGATAWIINQGTQTATVSAGGSKGLDELSWIFVEVTSIAGGKTYLTLKDEQNNIIDGFDKTEIPTLSVAGGLGKMTFVTSRYLANFAIDNILVRDVVDDASSSAGPEVDWNASTKTGTFSMPGSDVVLTPIYAKAAAFATTGTGSEAKTLLPEAAEGVIAGTDAPLIADGTGIVANIGETTTAQGTLMYAIGNSATQAPALTAFGATVPTAENVADDGADVLVWYYIQGADAPTGEAATLDNTFDNTEPACLTVQVLTNKFDITLNAANANTIEAGKATVTVGGTDKTGDITDGKLQGVKMGSEVKLEAKPGYKFRKVEVKKGAAAAAAKTITIGDMELTYADGDTWETIVSKNSDKIKILAGHYIVQVAQPAPNQYRFIHVWYNEVTPSDIIDPSKNYQWDTLKVNS